MAPQWHQTQSHPGPHHQQTRLWQRTLHWHYESTHTKTPDHPECQRQTHPQQPRSAHIAPHLTELHWLTIQQRCPFKLLTHAYKALHKAWPAYLIYPLNFHPATVLSHTLPCSDTLHPQKQISKTLRLLHRRQIMEWPSTSHQDLPTPTQVQQETKDLAVQLGARSAYSSTPAPGYPLGDRRTLQIHLT